MRRRRRASGSQRRERASGLAPLAFDQANVAGARSLLRILRSELDALTFAEQLEHGAANGAAMKEVLDPSLITNEAKTFVDQESCDCAGRHARVLRLLRTCCKVQTIQHLLLR